MKTLTLAALAALALALSACGSSNGCDASHPYACEQAKYGEEAAHKKAGEAQLAREGRCDPSQRFACEIANEVKEEVEGKP